MRVTWPVTTNLSPSTHTTTITKVVTDYLRPLPAPVGVKPAIKAWMELN